MKVLVRQISTELYWNSKTRWVQEQEAEAFADSGQAILFCVQRDMRDVHVVLRFGDPGMDVVLHPFGEGGQEPTSQELVQQSQNLKAKRKTIADGTRALLATVLQAIAQVKERKKQIPFERKRIGKEE